MTGPMLNLPPRPASALTGSKLYEEVKNLKLIAREERFCKEILGGNIPAFLRELRPVDVGSGAPNTTGTIYVTSDYLAIGSDDDYLRVPLSGICAQRIADALGCLLPTRKMVDDIYHHSKSRQTAIPLTDAIVEEHDPNLVVWGMTSLSWFRLHHVLVSGALKGTRSDLLAGHKKDIIVTKRLQVGSRRLAIYGFHKADGTVWQPMDPTLGIPLYHEDMYVDYSHGVRLVLGTMEINKKPHTLAKVLETDAQCALVSDEGPILKPRYEAGSPAPSPGGTGPGTDAQTPPELVLGPDVSNYQGSKIDWIEVAKASDIKFAFCKATEGVTFVDPSFARNWAALKETPLIRGAYHFGRPKNKAREEADHFLSKVGDEADLLALDLEVDDKQSSEHILEWATEFLEYLNTNTTSRVIMYTGGFWKFQLGNPAASAIGRFPLWLAQYGNVPVPPKAWGHWAFWQYTNGVDGPQTSLPKSIPGIGKCDVSQFNGSYQALQDFVAHAAPPPLAPPWAGRDLKLENPRMKGPDVYAWQKRMKDRGWTLTVDGSYGPQTRGVTLGFQKYMKIACDGVVSQATWDVAWA